MNIYKKLTSLNEQYLNSESEEQMQAISKERDRLIDESENPSELFEYVVKDAVKIAKALNVKATLEPVLQMINLNFISTTYFKKTRSWFYHRLNSNVVNGRRQHFSDDDIQRLKEALLDMAAKIEDTAKQL